MAGVAVLCGLAVAAAAAALASVLLVFSLSVLGLTCLALCAALAIFLTVRRDAMPVPMPLDPGHRVPRLTLWQTRHAQIVRRRRLTQWPRPPPRPDRPPSSARGQPHEYYLFVLGSGGHTKEMLMMMDDGFCDFAGFHRRYLVSSGDAMSEHHLRDYEEQLARLCRAAETSPGSHDKRIVTRARRVHQPLWTTPLTALLSFLDILPVLLSPPANAAGRTRRYPTQIFSNGPATGFLVGLAVHLLKLFCLVPEDSMRFVYIESWARISTLSLTAKLLHYTAVADALYVQHDEVAALYGLVNAGQMVFNSRRSDG